MQYLRSGRSYGDVLALILTRMVIFLLHFQISEGAESSTKPKIANFCKKIWLKMAKYEKNAVSQERLVV